jgi:hypothetical protein
MKAFNSGYECWEAAKTLTARGALTVAGRG